MKGRKGRKGRKGGREEGREEGGGKPPSVPNLSATVFSRVSCHLSVGPLDGSKGRCMAARQRQRQPQRPEGARPRPDDPRHGHAAGLGQRDREQPLPLAEPLQRALQRRGGWLTRVEVQGMWHLQFRDEESVPAVRREGRGFGRVQGIGTRVSIFRTQGHPSRGEDGRGHKGTYPGQMG